MKRNWREDLAAMDRVIIESGMHFIAENSFYIEKSNIYTKLGEGIKSIEFVRVIDNKLLFVEAKSTFPNPSNSSTANLARYQLEIK